MTHRRVIALCGLLAASGMVTSCSAETPSARGHDGNAAAALSPMCMPNAMQSCPCPGVVGVSGSQLCAADGKSFGACQGCPAPSAATGGAGASAGTGGAGGAVGAPGAGGAGGAAGSAGAAGASGEGGVGGASGAGGAAGAAGFPDSSLDVIEAEPGTSCGVGLVSLCALGTEKCCVRSLATDTCIPAADSCDCDVANCSVMEASCDGPEDCAMGQVCCGTLNSSGAGYDVFECATQCDNQGMQREACHQNMTECPGSLVCANSQLLTNLQVCIDPATIQQ